MIFVVYKSNINHIRCQYRPHNFLSTLALYNQGVDSCQICLDMGMYSRVYLVLVTDHIFCVSICGGYCITYMHYDNLFSPS